MRSLSRLRGHHQGSEGRWDDLIPLLFRPFCPCDGRQVSLGYLSAVCRYTAHRESLVKLSTPCDKLSDLGYNHTQASDHVDCATKEYG